MTEVDVERMSKVTGMPIDEIKSVLGMPLGVASSITTIQEACEAESKTSQYSIERIAVLKRWVELASTTDDLMKFWRVGHVDVLKASKYGEATRSFLLKKWDELSRSEVDRARTLPAAERAYINALLASDRTRAAAFKNWLEKTTTIDEALDVCRRGPRTAWAKNTAILKLATFFPQIR